MHLEVIVKAFKHGQYLLCECGDIRVLCLTLQAFQALGETGGVTIPLLFLAVEIARAESAVLVGSSDMANMEVVHVESNHRSFFNK